MRIKVKTVKGTDKELAKKLFYSAWNLEYLSNIKYCKKLINFSPKYRLRVGDYRIFFDINDDIILIKNIKQRKDACK